MNNSDLFLKQLEELIIEYTQLQRKSEFNDLSDLNESVELSALITKSVAAIQRIAGVKSEYYKSIKLVYTEISNYSYYGLILKNIIGIAYALKSDIEKDYLKSQRELIHSDVFSDYMEMANYLLSEGYKDPAAVIAGSTLESHMRKLCEKNSIDIEYENQKSRLT